MADRCPFEQIHIFFDGKAEQDRFRRLVTDQYPEALGKNKAIVRGYSVTSWPESPLTYAVVYLIQKGHLPSDFDPTSMQERLLENRGTVAAQRWFAFVIKRLATPPVATPVESSIRDEIVALFSRCMGAINEPGVRSAFAAKSILRPFAEAFDSPPSTMPDGAIREIACAFFAITARWACTSDDVEAPVTFVCLLLNTYVGSEEVGPWRKLAYSSRVDATADFVAAAKEYGAASQADYAKVFSKRAEGRRNNMGMGVLAALNQQDFSRDAS